MLSFLKRLFSKKDELIGHWHSDNEGGFMLVFGSTIDFKPDQTGSYSSWSSGDDESEEEEIRGYSHSGTFSWKRVSKNQICITEEDKDEIVTYSITHHIGGYGIKYYKLTSPSRKVGKTEIGGFWNFAQEMFRKK